MAYKEVTTGRTGHAEWTQIKFDPEIISYKELLEIFWKTHDPTTLNRQGNDIGTQYRSVIFYHNEEQKKMAEEFGADVCINVGKIGDEEAVETDVAASHSSDYK